MSYSLLRTTDKTPENLPRRERLNLQQRDEILKTALKLFSEKSYPNVSMHEIAREAEFGMGTLYKFFSSKEDLYKISYSADGRKVAPHCFTGPRTGTGSCTSDRKMYHHPSGTVF